MSKLEEYKKAKAISDKMRAFATEVNKEYDNHGVYASRRGFWVDKFRATITIDNASSGVYGSSSVYAWPEDVRLLMQEAMVQNMRKTALDAAVIAEERTEKARLAAKAEAEEVLKEVC